jgi:hypothetical protein
MKPYLLWLNILTLPFMLYGMEHMSHHMNFQEPDVVKIIHALEDYGIKRLQRLNPKIYNHINELDNDMTPLMKAAQKGNSDACQFLLSKGALVTLQNKQQKSAYDYATNETTKQVLLAWQLQNSKRKSH